LALQKIGAPDFLQAVLFTPGAGLSFLFELLQLNGLAFFISIVQSLPIP
jgi:hypothetical protein